MLHGQALNEKLKSTGGTMNFFSKKLLGHEIFCSIFPWATKMFLKNLYNPPTSPPFYKLYMHSLTNNLLNSNKPIAEITFGIQEQASGTPFDYCSIISEELQLSVRHFTKVLHKGFFSCFNDLRPWKYLLTFTYAN